MSALSERCSYECKTKCKLRSKARNLFRRRGNLTRFQSLFAVVTRALRAVSSVQMGFDLVQQIRK